MQQPSKRLGHMLRVFILLPVLAAATARAEWQIKVEPYPETLGPTPVTVAAPADLPTGTYRLASGEGDAGSALCYERGGKRWLAVVLPEVAANKAATYRLVAEAGDTKGIAIEAASAAGGNIRVNLDGSPFTELVLTERSKPYLYPVLGPGERPFTRAFPMKDIEGEDRDHPHQRSFWFTHGLVNGVDFWAADPLNGQNPKFGRIQARNVHSFTSQPAGAAGLIAMQDDWIGPDGKRVCEDERVLTFYAVDNPRIIDVDVTIKATDGPVTFGDTKEGMFGLRVPSSLNVNRKQGGKITNAEGITDLEAWGKPSPWVDYTGPLGDATVGIAIFNRPDSFRYPTTWHVRDYGLFAANPFGYGDFGLKQEGEHTLPAGESMRFAYRVLLHEGDTESARVAAAFRAYSEPPKLEVTNR